MSRVLDIDPFTGIVETFSYDAGNDAITLTRTQDVTAILDRNKALQNDTSEHWKDRSKGTESGIDMRLGAIVPNIIIEKWMRDHGVNIFDKEHLTAARRLINDSDWRWLKTVDVKI